MSYFKFDVKKVTNNIDNYKKIKKNCREVLTYVYSSFNDLDASWNDYNSKQFTNELKKDRYELDTYFEYLDALYGCLEDFKNDLVTAFSRCDYHRVSVVKFDDSSLQSAKKYLNTANTYLNNALYYLNAYSFATSPALSMIYNLRNEIKSMIYQINTLDNEINKIDKSVNDALIETAQKSKKIGAYNFKLKEALFRWHTADIEVKNNNLDLGENVSVHQNKIGIETINAEGNFNVETNAIKSDNIEMKELERAQNIYTNDTVVVQNTKIADNEIEKVQNLNEPIIPTILGENKIGIKENKDDPKFYDHSVATNMNKNEIEFNSYDYNIDVNSTNERDINQSNIELNINQKDYDLSKDGNNKITNQEIKVENINTGKVDIKFDDVKVEQNNMAIDQAKLNVGKVDTITADPANINFNTFDSGVDLQSGISKYELNSSNIHLNSSNGNLNVGENIKRVESIEDFRK